jgi:glycosyltransferase involved in cell wall biosynthesis
MIAVSVIIPVYNAEKHLVKSIESLLNQSLVDCEFIFISDGSTDNSVAIISEYQKNDNRIHLIHQENQGVSAARNKGIQLAKGEFIGFLDADDYIDSDFFQTLFEIAQKENSDIVSSHFFKEFNSNNEILKAKFPLNVKLDKDFINQNIIPQFIKDSSLNSCWNKLFKASLVKDIQFPIGVPLGEDGIFNLQAFNKSNTAFFADYCGYHYIEVEGSATRNAAQKDYFKRALEVYGFDYQKLISFDLDKSKVEQWKSIRLLESVVSYIYLYLQSSSGLSFFNRIKYVKHMISNPIVQKVSHQYYQEISKGKSKYQQNILNCIRNQSIFKLIVMHQYSQFRNK